MTCTNGKEACINTNFISFIAGQISNTISFLHFPPKIIQIYFFNFTYKSLHLISYLNCLCLHCPTTVNHHTGSTTTNCHAPHCISPPFHSIPPHRSLSSPSTRRYPPLQSTMIRHHKPRPWLATAAMNNYLSPRNHNSCHRTAPEPPRRRLARTAVSSPRRRRLMAAAPRRRLDPRVLCPKLTPVPFPFVNVVPVLFSFFFFFLVMAFIFAELFP